MYDANCSDSAGSDAALRSVGGVDAAIACRKRSRGSMDDMIIGTV